jgi:hypothetical protein
MRHPPLSPENDMTTEQREEILNNIECLMGSESRAYWAHKSDAALAEWQAREDWCMEHEFDDIWDIH